MFRRLVFDIALNNDSVILAQMTAYRVDWISHLLDRQKTVFDFLSLCGYAMVTRNKDDGDIVDIMWELPSSLADFLIAKYEGNPAVELGFLRKWIDKKNAIKEKIA